MKNQKRMSKKMVCTVIVCILVMLFSSAMAGTSVNGGTLMGVTKDQDMYDVIDFKFQHREFGIGCGVCPVYTAPSLDAYRCANGKAACSTDDELDVCAFDMNGWLMVRYGTNNGGVRVGYIPPSYVRQYSRQFTRTIEFDYIKQTAYDTLYVTDNTMDHYSAFATLDPGETYYILGKYTYHNNWWYIECMVDGQIARGFIDRDTTRVDMGDGVPTTDLGYPELSPFGMGKIGMVTVTGDASMVRKDAGANFDMVARVQTGEQYPVYAMKTVSNKKTWYFIYVDGVWGWISEGRARFTQD